MLLNNLVGICTFGVWPGVFPVDLGFPFDPPLASCQAEAQFFPQNSKF